MDVGDFLKRIRVSKGMSVREVAKAVGFSASSLSEYENGRTDPPSSKFLKLCEFYNIPLLSTLQETVEVLDYSKFTEESKTKVRAIERFERSVNFKI